MSDAFILFGVFVGLFGLGVSWTLFNTGLKVEVVEYKKMKRD